MSEVTVRTRKFLGNRLLRRRQCVVEVMHHGKANVSRKDLTDKLAKMYKVDPGVVVLYGFRTRFGGGKSSGFALIYDDISALKEFEPNYRQIRLGVKPKREGSRKQIKEKKNRTKRLWATTKVKGEKPKKKKQE